MQPGPQLGVSPREGQPGTRPQVETAPVTHLIPIVWLGEPLAQDPALVGQQVAILNRLVDQHRVPPGFCLTRRAFPIAPAQVASVTAVVAAYQQLGERCGSTELAVTIRTCAVEEQEPGKVFLNVQGTPAVVCMVQMCWQAGLTVFIQQFIAADVTALAYSANPSIGNRAEVVIHAAWGLGDSQEKGLVAPDIYIVSKADPGVYAVRVADKVRKLVAVPGGVELVDVPPSLQREMALSEWQIAEITRLVQVAEAQVGQPVAIECAYLGEIIYLLRCQPISLLGGQEHVKGKRTV